MSQQQFFSFFFLHLVCTAWSVTQITRTLTLSAGKRGNNESKTGIETLMNRANHSKEWTKTNYRSSCSFDWTQWCPDCTLRETALKACRVCLQSVITRHKKRRTRNEERMVTQDLAVQMERMDRWTWNFRVGRPSVFFNPFDSLSFSDFRLLSL